ncbi:MAG TPA: hypothetical protein VHC00_07045 [Rhizobiaceae bacterium]|nr:hypothetical protein [Rhizobiaceae bacterium]
MNMLHQTVRSGSEKARIWQICDELYARNGRVPSGREVVDLYVAEGGNAGTGFTQYSHWKKEILTQAEIEDDGFATQPASVPFRAMTITADGHLVLPPDIRKAMLLDADGRITVNVVDGELRAISPMSAVHQLQRRALSLVPAGTLVSDELIAERRAEADRNG